MTKADFYEVLGVARTCDDKTLKSAFRKLAMQYHPDRNPGDQNAEVKFKEVSFAYEVLKDPQKRAAYDRYGHAAFENGGNGGGFTGDFASSMSDSEPPHLPSARIGSTRIFQPTPAMPVALFAVAATTPAM